jgi:hypothetical protein
MTRRRGKETRAERIERLSELLDLVDRLEGKQAGTDVWPRLEDLANLKACVVLIGRLETLRTRGADPYVSYIRRAIRGGIDTFYLLASGELAIKVAEKVAEVASKTTPLSEEIRFDWANLPNQPACPTALICLESPRSAKLDAGVARRQSSSVLSEVQPPKTWHAVTGHSPTAPL